MLLDGIHVPLTVPFYADGGSYLKKLEHNVRRYCLGPISGLLALAPGSEAEALSDDEQVAMLAMVAGAAAPEKVLIAGIRRDSVRQTLALARRAADLDFDAVTLAAPFSWPRLRGGQGTSGELALYFRAVADQSPLPVVLWSQARLPELQLHTELLGSLCAHPNILGLYDVDCSPGRLAAIRAHTASVDREVIVTPVFAPVTQRMLQVRAAPASNFVSTEQLTGGVAAQAAVPPVSALRTRTRRVGFQLMAGGAMSGVAKLLAEGVAGALPRLAACAPQACHEVYAAFKDGNATLALEKEARLLTADQLLEVYGPAGIKYACDLNGFYGGRPRLPGLPLTSAERVEVENALRPVRQ